MRTIIIGAVGAAAAAETGTSAYIIKPTTGHQRPTKNSPAVITPDPNAGTAFVPKDVISVGGDLPNCWPNGR